MAIGDCCVTGPNGGDSLCPHAATGFCLVSDGSPVIVVTTVDCLTGEVSVVLIDPNTGLPIPPEPVTPCGSRDWEVNQLCDYDPVTGDLIATFIQIYEWNEDTQVLMISYVRADNPAIPYVPVGQVRSCTDDESAVDVEITEFCYDPPGVDPLAHGWHVWIFLDGVHTGDVYYDAAGTVLVAPVIVECPDLATELTLGSLLSATVGIGINIGDLGACCAAQTALLALINGNTDQIEAILTAIDGHVDGLEACCAASNVILSAIDGHVDGLEGLLGTTNTTLQAIVDLENNDILVNTAAPLGAGGVFLSAWFDVLQYAEVTIGVYADQASAAGGLQVEWSTDGVTVHDMDNSTVVAADGQQLGFGPKFRYFRIRYTNGGVAQGTFVLQVIGHHVRTKPSTHINTSDVPAAQDGELVISIPKLLSDAGTFVSARSTNGGIARTDVVPSAAGSAGQATVGVASAALPAVAARRVMLRSGIANLGIIYINPGAAATVAASFPMAAGDVLVIAVDNLSDIRAISNLPAQDLRYIVLDPVA